MDFKFRHAKIHCHSVLKYFFLFPVKSPLQPCSVEPWTSTLLCKRSSRSPLWPMDSFTEFTRPAKLWTSKNFYLELKDWKRLLDWKTVLIAFHHLTDQIVNDSIPSFQTSSRALHFGRELRRAPVQEAYPSFVPGAPDPPHPRGFPQETRRVVRSVQDWQGRQAKEDLRLLLRCRQGEELFWGYVECIN